MKNLKALLSLVVLSVVSTACGNMASSVPDGSAWSATGYTQNGNYTNTAASQCAPTANVTGQSYTSSVQSQYRVCRTSVTGTINLFPEDGTTKQICVYPVITNGSQAGVYTQAAKCTTISASGISLNFIGVNMNAAYIVNYAVSQAFQTCLSWSASGMGSVSTCAAQYGISAQYGYGQF